MLGCTESVFSAIPEEHKKVPQYTPLSTLRHQSKQKHQKTASDLARTAATAKLKLPMETNRLETGPPVKRLNPEPVTSAQKLKMLKLSVSDQTPKAMSDCTPINGESSMSLETSKLSVIAGQCYPMSKPSLVSVPMEGLTNTPAMMSPDRTMSSTMISRPEMASPMVSPTNLVPPVSTKAIQVAPLGSLPHRVQSQMSGQITMSARDIPSMSNATDSPLHGRKSVFSITLIIDIEHIVLLHVFFCNNTADVNPRWAIVGEDPCTTWAPNK